MGKTNVLNNGIDQAVEQVPLPRVAKLHEFVDALDHLTQVPAVGEQLGTTLGTVAREG